MAFKVAKIGDRYLWYFRWYTSVSSNMPSNPSSTVIEYIISDIAESSKTDALCDMLSFMKDRAIVSSLSFATDVVSMWVMADIELIISDRDTVELKLRYGDEGLIENVY